MTIYKELLDYSVPLSELADRASNRLDLKTLQHLCLLFGLAIYGTKAKVAKRLVDHIGSALHPRFREFQLLAPRDQYEGVVTEVENYLYSKSKDPKDPSPEPLIFTQMPAIQSLLGAEQDEELEPEEEKEEPIHTSSSLTDTYHQFAVLYLLDVLEQDHRPNINGFKNYLIKEASILRPDRAIIEDVYNKIVRQLKSYDSVDDKIRHLQRLLPSISRSPSRERTKSPTLSLKAHIYKYLLESYDNNKSTKAVFLYPYLNRHNIKGYSRSVIKQAYDEIQQEVEPYRREKTKKIEFVRGLLQQESGGSTTTNDNEPQEPEVSDEIEEGELLEVPSSPLEEIESESEEEKEEAEPLEYPPSPLEEAEPLELPLSALEEAVEAPEVCNIMETHPTLETLAEDLSCSGTKVCDVDRQVCVEATPEVEVMSLQIGDKTIPITGKSDGEVIREIKREIVTLTTQIQRQERNQREKMLELKKFISTPVDLDKLWSSLRSFQSSQQLFTQRKVQQANQELREKMKKCLFV